MRKFYGRVSFFLNLIYHYRFQVYRGFENSGRDFLKKNTNFQKREK